MKIKSRHLLRRTARAKAKRLNRKFAKANGWPSSYRYTVIEASRGPANWYVVDTKPARYET
jgi:hypothetical protein